MTSRSHVTRLLRGSAAHRRITMMLLLSGICAMLLLWDAAPAHAQSITITDHAPVTNAVGVAVSSPITASFDATVQANTVTTRTFTVRSSLRGLFTDTATVSGNTVTVDPGRNFFTGEQVQVVGTAAISGTGAVPLRALQWGFTAGPVTNRCVASFTDINAGLPGVYDSSVAWGDYDNDGDLDILLTGQRGTSGSQITRVYRSDDCPDVGISKTVTPAISVPGTAIAYTLHFSNTGPGIASSVTLTDSVPAGVAITGVSSSGAPITQTAGSPNFAWAVSDLAPGAGGVITLTGVTIGIFDADTVITNTAAITTPGDANAGNNLAAAPLAVNLHRVAFSAATYTAAEADGAVTVTVTLNAPNPVTAVSVVVQSSDGSASAPDDYTPVSRTLNFPAGTQQVAFSVPLVDDGIAEQPEVFTLALSAPTNAALGAPAVATVTLVNSSQLFLPTVTR